MIPLRTFDIQRAFLFHKRLFVVEEGSQDYKNNIFHKDYSLWNQKWFFYDIAVKNLLSTFIF